MLKEIVYILTGDRNYENFFSMIDQYFESKAVCFKPDEIIENIKKDIRESTKTGENIFVLFVEYPFLDMISSYINENLNLSSYILVGFYSQKQPGISRYSNLYDFVSTGCEGFDYTFFFQKLTKEISNKTRISFLQSEVAQFYEIGKSLSSEKDTLKLFDMIIDSSISLTSSDAGTIYIIVDRESGKWSSITGNSMKNKLLKFVIAKCASIDIQLEESISPVSCKSIFGYTAITGKSLRIDDAYKISPELDYRHNHKYDENTGYLTRSILSIPMKDHENNVTGVIQLINKKKIKDIKINCSDRDTLDNIIPYDYSDELIMNSLAGQASVALENNLLYRDMQNLLQEYKQQNNHLIFLSKEILKAHEEERKRIAREIHDGPAQSAVNLGFKLELCKRYMQSQDYDKLTDEMNTLSGAIRSTTKEIRTIIYDLKPSYLEDGLIKSLDNLIEVFMDNTGIKVDYTVNGNDKNVEYYMTSTIYRIVQEALSNTFKHAKAYQVKVDIVINERSIFLEISDDGKGFDVEGLGKRKVNRMEGGFGLEGMRERVELVRGKMQVKSSPGNGTTVTINIPLG